MFKSKFCEIQNLESRKVLRLLSIFMVHYFLRAVYNSTIYTLLFFLWGKMLVIPCAAKVDFCFLTPNDINMPDWPSLAIFFTIFMVWTITASVCLLECLTDIIRILGDHLKSNGTSFQGIVWTKWVSKCKGARSAHHILFFVIFSFRGSLVRQNKHDVIPSEKSWNWTNYLASLKCLP